MNTNTIEQQRQQFFNNSVKKVVSYDHMQRTAEFPYTALENYIHAIAAAHGIDPTMQGEEALYPRGFQEDEINELQALMRKDMESQQHLDPNRLVDGEQFIRDFFAGLGQDSDSGSITLTASDAQMVTIPLDD